MADENGRFGGLAGHFFYGMYFPDGGVVPPGQGRGAAGEFWAFKARYSGPTAELLRSYHGDTSDKSIFILSPETSFFWKWGDGVAKGAKKIIFFFVYSEKFVSLYFQYIMHYSSIRLNVRR